MSPKRLVALWGPVAAAMVAIAVVAVQPPDNLKMLALLWDKSVHAAGYFTVGVLALRATHDGRGPMRPAPLALAGALTMGHGGGVELLQAVIPWREASLGDFAADVVGFLLAVAAARGWEVLRAARAGPREEGS